VTVHKDFLARPFLADSHSHPVPDDALDLLDRVLVRHRPDAIVLERDDRLQEFDEILADVRRIRACVDAVQSENGHASALVAASD